MVRPGALCFDMDGLLADTEPIHIEAHVRALRRRGIECETGTFAAFVGLPVAETAAEIKRKFSLPESVEKLVSEQEEAFLDLLADRYLCPLPGVREYLREAKARGVPVAVVTSSASRIAAAVLSKLLDALGVPRIAPGDFFATVVSGEDVAKRKPAPDIYLEAARRLRAEPPDCLAFEDSPAGVASAKAAGMRCVGVPSQYVPRAAMAGADALYTTLREAFLAGEWPAAGAGGPKIRKARRGRKTG
ncbi:MAG: HAD family phosphatase [Planctomycetota bacterium]|nr:HAD family phosphatase [Planctomycetota bacterium]